MDGVLDNSVNESSWESGSHTGPGRPPKENLDLLHDIHFSLSISNITIVKETRKYIEHVLKLYVITYD